MQIFMRWQKSRSQNKRWRRSDGALMCSRWQGLATARACNDTAVGARSRPDLMSGGGGDAQIGLAGFVDGLNRLHQWSH